MRSVDGDRKRASSSIGEEDEKSLKHPKFIPEEDLLEAQDEFASLNGTIHVGPTQMAQIVEELKRYFDLNKRGVNRRFSNFGNYDVVNLPQGTDSETVRSDIRRYFKEATMLSSISLITALDVVAAFLKEGRSITLDPLFPKKPLNAFQIFQKTKASSQNGSYFDSVGKIAAQWKDESCAEERLAAEEEMRRQFKEYAEQLIRYKEKSTHLSNEHRQYIDKQITLALKTSKVSERSTARSLNREKKGPQKKLCKTPFDLFVLSIGDKYSELDPEKRERKLRKKFSKLNEEDLQKYENLSRLL